MLVLSDLDYRASAHGCTRCPALCESRTTIVDGCGPMNPLLMVIGDAPDEWADKQATPFVSDAGKLLRGTLFELGINATEEVYYTNAIRCRPSDNRTPDDAEAGNCADWLQREIDAIQPHALLLLGRTAQRTVERLHVNFLPPTFSAAHPASLLRAPGKRAAWKRDLAVAVNYVARNQAPAILPPTAPWSVGVINPQSRWIAIDTETKTLEENWSPEYVCWQVSDGTRAQLIRNGWNRPPDLSGWPHVYFAHAAYDAPKVGISLRDYDRWDDVQLMAYLLRYERVGLKELGPALTGLGMESIQGILKRLEVTERVLKSGPNKGTIKRTEKWIKQSFAEALQLDPDRARHYAMLDAVVTSRLARIIEPALRDVPVLWNRYRSLEKPIAAVLLDMERVGTRVNTERLRALGDELDRRITDADVELVDLLGTSDDFNANSTEQLANHLISVGVELKRKTETGKWKLDKATFLELAGVEHEDQLEDCDSYVGFVAEASLRSRKLRKLKTTYVQRLLADKDSNDRVHGKYNQMVTDTNRFSSSEPNLQNIPVQGPLKKAIRECFIPREGYTFVRADASQAELRIFAHFTRDAALIDAYTHRNHDQNGPEGGCLRCDVHQGAANALGIPRKRAKNVRFCALYGGDAPKLAETAGVPAAEASSFLKTMKAEMPSLLEWPKMVRYELSTKGYVETILGFRGYYPLFASPLIREVKAALRSAGNMPIQGSCADIVKTWMVHCDEEICPKFDAILNLQVHDECVWEVPHHAVPEFAQAIHATGPIITESTGMTVPIVFEVETGPTWGDTVPYHFA